MNREKLIQAFVTLAIAIVPAVLVYMQSRHETTLKYDLAKHQSSIGYETLAKSVEELQREVALLRLVRQVEVRSDHPQPAPFSPTAFREPPATLDMALRQRAVSPAP